VETRAARKEILRRISNVPGYSLPMFWLLLFFHRHGTCFVFHRHGTYSVFSHRH
jgi:hypothetical protein